MKSTTLTLRLPVDMMERLDKLAETTQRTRSSLGCEAISRYLDLDPDASAQTCAISLQAGGGSFAERPATID